MQRAPESGLSPQTGVTHRGLTQPDPLVAKRIDRAVKSARPYEATWDEALLFYDNQQWVEQSAINGSIQRVETREGDSNAKPRWRSRLTRNRYTSAIESEKSACAARIPVPECTAPSGDRRHAGMANLAEKVLLGLFRKFGMKQMVLDTMTYTFNCGAGYVWPYWNTNVGEFIEDPETGEVLRTGDIGFWVLGPSEVGWEPGVKFEDSRWHYVRKAQAVSEVVEREGYIGAPELKADAQASVHESGRDAVSAELVFVFHYLERPSKKHPRGRWLQIAGGHLIAEPADYPCEYDMPVLHNLDDMRREHRDRPMGRGELMIDVQRTYNRTVNQIIAWKNLVLNPSLLAPKGSLRTQITGAPGEVIEYRPVGGQVPQWRDVPPIPDSYFRTLDQCISDWQEITGQHVLPTGMTSGTGVQAINERDDTRRAAFVENLAVFYGRLFEHVLYLVQKHYTEPRVIEYKSRFGTESIADFMGGQLMPGIHVHVNPGSIEPRTKAAQEAKIIMFAERGWLPPHQVMAALRSGNADTIIDDFELDVAKANREIQQLIDMTRGVGLGPVFASPGDNHQVHLDVLKAWMKTEDFERQDDLTKQAALAHLEQHEVEMQIAVFQQQMEAQGVHTDPQAGVQMGGRPMGGPPGQSGAGGGPVGAADANLTSLPGLEGTVAGLQGAPRPY